MRSRSGTRRRFTVALIGPDGAGKTTIARRLEHELGMPAKYIYMGVNRDASTHMLPTTRLIRAVKRARGVPPDTAGPPDPVEMTRPRPKGMRRRMLRGLRTSARLANQLADELYREVLAWSYVRRGWVVVFDRHFFSDFHAYDIVGGRERPLENRLHGFFLSRLAPKPDLVVYLDAPPEVLLARKGEGTLEALERRRHDYFSLGAVVEQFAVVDASRSADDVARDVVDVITSFAETGHTAARAVPHRH